MKPSDYFITSNKILVALLLVFSLTLLSSPESRAQSSWVSEAQQDGFTLKKVVSDTVIPSGQTFTYSIYFSIPAGATAVTVSDVLPASIEYLSGTYTAPCGTPTVSAPLVSSLGGTYSLTFASLPSGCSGSFTLTVRFPNGTTCNNTTARNRACITGVLAGKTVEFCTGYVSTRATAVEPWNINKYVIGAAYQGGTCPYATADSVLNYQVCVYKNVGTTGQLNLSAGIVTDVLPAGAVLTGSTCGATQTGNTITWNVGGLSALPMYNTVCCTFTVLYPRATFPTGSTITNKAVLSGTLGSSQNPCGTLSDTSNQSCVEIKDIVSATISKYVYTNRQPGCAGKYQIWICNNGTSTLSSFTVTDTIPTTLTGLSIGTTSAGLTANLVGNIATATSTSALAPGQCRYFEINFTIPAAAVVGSTITNCAWFTSAGVAPIKACVSFVVSAPAPQVCIWKDVCGKLPSYAPGSTFRYRMRVQNIGGQPLTGSTITDALNGNIEYVGNPSYYTSTAWNAPCQPTSNWTGVTLAYNSGTHTVSAALPTIPAVCQNIFYSNCGMYGTNGVLFYFIEFDVKVSDSSALGNIPNAFTISGGTLPSGVTSNVELVTVAGTAGYTLDKSVKENPSGSYGSSATASAGGSIAYRLRLTVPTGSVGLRHVTFADLLPRDNGVNDQLILGPCTSRGSAFDVTYALPALASTPATTTWNNPTSFARVNTYQPTGAPAAMFTGGCGTLGTWVAGLTTGAKNAGWYFGSAPISALGTATAQMNGLVSSTAADSAVACNTFAASAAVRHLINSTIISDQVIGQLESGPVCVRVVKKEVSGCIDSIRVKIDCDGKDAAGNQLYNVQITGTNSGGAGILVLNSTQGTFAPASFVIPSGPFVVNTVFTDTPPVSTLITIGYGLMGNNGQIICRDSVKYDLPPCPGLPPDDCCKEFIKRIDKTKITFNNAGGVQLSATITAGAAPIQKFIASIIGVQLRTKCGSAPASAWQRAFGDIVSGSLSSPLSPGPQLLSVYSRVAQWGTGECQNFMQGVNMNLNMMFPPPPASFKCNDTLIFTIRYTFTDCKCNTCEMVKRDTVVRRRTFKPWDDVGILFPHRLGSLADGGSKRGENVQADSAKTTSVTMTDKNNGTLHIINPAANDNRVEVLGVEVTSNMVPLLSITNDGNKIPVIGATGYSGASVPPGSNVQVGLEFNNSTSLMKFPLDVRFLYNDGTGSGPEFSEVVHFVARVPGGTPDEVSADATTKPVNVKTYAVFFKNANSYSDRTSVLRIRSKSSARILAVGPANTNSAEALLAPVANDAGAYMITALENGEGGVGAGVTVKPIYLTLSNVDGNTAEFDFETTDDIGNTISSGTFVLSSPISGIRESGGDIGNPVALINVMPNPAGTGATVSLTLNTFVHAADMTISDLNGKVIQTLVSGPLDGGSHIIPINVSNMSNGAYFIVFNTPFGTQSLPLNVVK
ncbi:MAG: DUF11 domain-containing protein [Ignavibacteria bacterium]|nr:DUF11 domain-containing protein [Ignavibacteria bacterium]